MNQFAKTLLEWRTARRWTQAAAAEYLAKELGADLPLKTYQGWEYGQNQPHGITKAAIENVINK